MKAVLDIKDEIILENSGLFLWEVSETESRCSKLADDASAEEDILKIAVSIAELTEFLFGKRNIVGLDDIEVLSRICINEAV